MNYKIADDYVLATGKKHTVKEFLEMVLSYLNISYYWKGDECFDKKNNILISTIDKKYFRPAEVDLLIGDSTKAKAILGWAPKYNLEKIIIDMVDADLKRYYNKN
jgi:GDPmannose 4,6-dehydratase